MTRKNDKRDRLVDAADELIYQQTFNSTTLADIATRADVPLGNVYYYFKTKEDILKAVVQKRALSLELQFAAWDKLETPERLRAFVRESALTSETTARYGSELGSLCQELGKETSEIANLASDLMQKLVSWVEKQFKDLGKGERSMTLAEHLIARIQGLSLLTLTFKDPSFLQNQTTHLESWIETA
jgi:TetR/AcrR family transcriptional repressor of nem operon